MCPINIVTSENNLTGLHDNTGNVYIYIYISISYIYTYTNIYTIHTCIYVCMRYRKIQKVLLYIVKMEIK